MRGKLGSRQFNKSPTNKEQNEKVKLAQKNPAMIHKNKTKTTENILAFLQPLTVLSIQFI